MWVRERAVVAKTTLGIGKVQILGSSFVQVFLNCTPLVPTIVTEREGFTQVRSSVYHNWGVCPVDEARRVV